MNQYKDIYDLIDAQKVKGICFDSRQVKKDFLFVAQKGTKVDGHEFIADCISKGARYIVCEHIPQGIDEKSAQFFVVKDSQEALGEISSYYYGEPSKHLKIVGITGTNGKTTTVTLLYNLFISLGYHCGLLSTIVNKINGKEIKSTHTTSDAIELNALLSQMVKDGCEYVFMEVSSHAIVQRRIAGVHFTGAIFSNITHDHLDFHKTFANYIKAKKKFFDDLTKDAFALTNIDDNNGLVMIQNTKAHRYTYSLSTLADFHAVVLENNFEGQLLNINNIDVWIKLIGRFNAYNILAIYSTAVLLGADKDDILKEISRLDSAEGRFNCVLTKSGAKAIIDYAHTPDALQNVISTINDIRGSKGDLITVVGCGGDRDKTKRPEMAQIAVQNSDRVILTSDNPRTEDPEQILQDMQKGINPSQENKVITITNRKEAIKTACTMAKKDDIILVAGKGHEKYQEINGVRNHFDDKEEVLKY